MGCCGSDLFAMPMSPDTWVNDQSTDNESKNGFPENTTYEWSGSLEDPGCFLGCCRTKSFKLTMACSGNGSVTGSTTGSVGEYEVKGRWKRARVMFVMEHNAERLTLVGQLQADNRRLLGRWKSTAASSQNGVFELTRRDGGPTKKLNPKEQRKLDYDNLHNIDFNAGR